MDDLCTVEEVMADEDTDIDPVMDMDVVDLVWDELSDHGTTWQDNGTNMKRHMYKLTHQNIVPGRIGQVIPVTTPTVWVR